MPDLPPPEPPVQIAVEREIELARAASFRLLPPRNACAQSEPGTIVVCGPPPAEDFLTGPPLPPPPTAMEAIAEKLRLKVGPAEIRPNGLGIGMRIRF